MTVIQLLSTGILNSTRHPDISSAPIEVQAEIISAVNAALQTYHLHAPDILKRTTATTILGAPRTVTGLSIAVNSTSNTGTAFSAADRGKTIKIGETYNEIASTTTLLTPNTTGATVTSATIYDDTIVFFDASVERIVTLPRCTRGNQSWTLARLEGDHVRRLFAWHHASPFLRAMGAFSMQDRATGDDPAFFGVLPVGQSVYSGTLDAAFMLRVDPLPLRECVFEVSLDQLPPTYKTSAIWDESVLPVPAERIYPLLLPLLKAEMATTSIWTGNQVQTDLAIRGKADAIYFLQRLPNAFAPSAAVVGTAMGY